MIVARENSMLIKVNSDLAYYVGSSENTPVSFDPSHKSALQYFQDENIKVGINLGDTLSAFSFPGAYGVGDPYTNEGAWLAPITQMYINSLKNIGFSITRLMFGLLSKIGPAPTYTLDSTWVNRLKEVADYHGNAGMKCVFCFGDCLWMPEYPYVWCHLKAVLDDPTDVTNNNTGSVVRNELNAKITAVWSQLANAFKDYGDWVMFEPFNELNYYPYGSTSSAPVGTDDLINEWNQVASDAIRSTGGKNATRYLVFTGYNATYDVADKNFNFVLPTDAIPGNQVVAFHLYMPGAFAHNGENPDWPGIYSTDVDNRFGFPHNFDYVYQRFKYKFIDKGIPVYQGENGPFWYSFSSPPETATPTELEINRVARLRYVNMMYSKCQEYGVVPSYWDASHDQTSLMMRATGLPDDSDGRDSSALVAAMVNPVATVPVSQLSASPLTINFAFTEYDKATATITVKANMALSNNQDYKLKYEFKSNCILWQVTYSWDASEMFNLRNIPRNVLCQGEAIFKTTRSVSNGENITVDLYVSEFEDPPSSIIFTEAKFEFSAV